MSGAGMATERVGSRQRWRGGCTCWVFLALVVRLQSCAAFADVYAQVSSLSVSFSVSVSVLPPLSVFL